MEIALAVIRGPRGIVWIERGTPPSVGRWALPGGRIEPGEEPLEAARREAREETGLVLAAGRPLAVLHERFEEPDGSHRYDIVVHAALFDDPGAAPIADDGVTDARWAATPPAPALEPDRRLALLPAEGAPHAIAARIVVVGDDLAVHEWIVAPPAGH